MSKQKAWYKKISIKNVTAAIGTVASFWQGGLAGAAGGNPNPAQTGGQGDDGGGQASKFFSSPAGIATIIGGVILLVVVVRKL